MSEDFGMLTIFDDGGTGSKPFLQVGADGRVTAFNGHVDLGTGVETALAQIVAEELDVPLDHVTVVLGDTQRTPDQGATIASETIQIAAVPLRIAAAQARHYLLGMAARRLNAPPDRVATADGKVIWREDHVPYGALVAGHDVTLRLDRSIAPKDPKDYRIVGTSVPRSDLPAKVRGDFSYIHDLVVDEMLHGHVVRPPYAGRDSGDFIGRSLLHVDEDSVAGMDGLIGIVRKNDFLGVVAQRADQAAEIAKALNVEWACPPVGPDLSDMAQALKDYPATPRVLDTTGDFASGLAGCTTTMERTYVWPYHAHGSIGPSCAVADWNDGKPTVWSGTQNPHMLAEDLAMLMQIAAEDIDVRRLQAAGCYGRNCADDVCGDALLLSRAVGRPVRVQLTRAQETLWEPKGGAQMMEVSGGIGRDGDIGAYAMDSWYPCNRGPNLALLLTGRISPEPQQADMGDRTVIPPYRIPNKRITVHDIAPMVRSAWMRGVSALPHTFAHESFVDELAHAAGEDPVAFRLRHLDDPRTRDLVRRTAEEGDWTPQSGPRLRREGRMAYGRGFAYATYVHGTFPGKAAAAAAWVCDVTVDTQTGEVTLTRVLVGQDQGLVINPDGVRAQIHGNVIQTASRALVEEVRFDTITPLPQSWATYPIQTFDEVPAIRTMLIERPGDPALGVGESAAVPAAAAIANAIFDATGVRLRDAPFTPEKMRIGLAAVGGLAALPGGMRAPHRPAKRRIAATVAALGSALTLAAVALPTARAIPAQPAPPASSFSDALIAQGAEVFAAGDCAVCHTASDGVPNAGGRGMQTPFGTVYTTNLTPDPETGLGNWSFQAFDRAMRRGISRDGHNLYPAFPYTSFAKIMPDDMFALYAYLQTLPAVSAPTPASQMIAPVNLRPVNAVWNAMFLDTAPFAPDPAQSDAWNRGKYLVEGAGHCSACHTPRNALGAERTGTAALAGAEVDGWFAPALAGAEPAMRGWDEQRYYDYLRQGHAPDIASASGPMAEVVHSLQGVADSDVQAMATYLATLADPTVAAVPVVPPAATVPDATSRLFRTACASCHEPGLSDTLTAAQVPLGRSAAIRAPSRQALTTVIMNGIDAPLDLPLRDMPGFGGELSAQQIESLTDFLRERYAPDLPAWSAR
ncbi:MAG: molybdopterin-dependent oxidoreductase [Loktanella sp.]|nr:molybdopterin-dependent oxidoreductase [Loktanella sp.]